MSKSPIYCEHAKEMPNECPCNDDCCCKEHFCKPKGSLAEFNSIWSPISDRYTQIQRDIALSWFNRGWRQRGMRSQEEFCFVRDDFDAWYVVPVEKKEEWENWEERRRHGQPKLPEWARQVSEVEDVVFSSYIVI